MSNPIHLTYNPTDKYLVIADEYYTIYETAEECKTAYEAACPRDIGNSPWGAIRMMAPKQADTHASWLSEKDREQMPIVDITLDRILISSLAAKAEELNAAIDAEIADDPSSKIDWDLNWLEEKLKEKNP